MLLFNCLSMQETVVKRKYNFLTNYVKSDNILCCVCQNTVDCLYLCLYILYLPFLVNNVVWYYGE